MIVDQDHLSGGGSWLALLSIMLCAFCTNMAAALALAVIQDTLGHLDSYQDGDYSGILLRLEYLNRIIINFGDLPDSIVAGIGSAITCLSSAQRSSVPCTYRANRLLTGRRGRPPFDVSEDQLVFLVDSQCKMGLIGLHDSSARVQNSLFIVWLSRVCL